MSSTPQKQPAANAASWCPDLATSLVPAPTPPGSVPTTRRLGASGVVMAAGFIFVGSGSGAETVPVLLQATRTRVAARRSFGFTKYCTGPSERGYGGSGEEHDARDLGRGADPHRGSGGSEAAVHIELGTGALVGPGD